MRARRSQRGLTPLLGYLRGQGATPQTVPPACTPVQRMVGDYRIYLAQERGLVAGTIRRYQRDAGLFLTEYLARDDCDFGALTPGEVTDFVLRECRRRGPGSAKNLVTSLRSLLRFCYLQGHTARQLARAVPAAAGWRGGALPRGMDAGQVSRLLRSCDQTFVWASCRAGSAAFGDRKDRVGDEAVRLAVHGDRGVGVRSLDQAEDPAVLLVNPVLPVVHAVPALGVEVGTMGSGDLLG